MVTSHKRYEQIGLEIVLILGLSATLSALCSMPGHKCKGMQMGKGGGLKKFQKWCYNSFEQPLGELKAMPNYFIPPFSSR